MKRSVRNGVSPAQYDAWFRQKVAEGIAEACAGHLLSAEDVEAEFAERRAATRLEIARQAALK
jgi:hypothetical protein